MTCFGENMSVLLVSARIFQYFLAPPPTRCRWCVPVCACVCARARLRAHARLLFTSVCVRLAACFAGVCPPSGEWRADANARKQGGGRPGRGRIHTGRWRRAAPVVGLAPRLRAARFWCLLAFTLAGPCASPSADARARPPPPHDEIGCFRAVTARCPRACFVRPSALPAPLALLSPLPFASRVCPLSIAQQQPTHGRRAA